MKIATLNKARRKLAFEIVEYLDRWIINNNGVFDIDEAAKDL